MRRIMISETATMTITGLSEESVVTKCELSSK